MAPTKTRLRRLVGGSLVASAFVYAFLAYFITSEGPGGIADGLGRTLTEAPALAKSLGRGSMWPGLIWTVADTVIFFALIGVGFSLQER